VSSLRSASAQNRKKLKLIFAVQKKLKMEKFLAEKIADPIADLRSRITDKDVDAALATKYFSKIKY